MSHIGESEAKFREFRSLVRGFKRESLLRRVAAFTAADAQTTLESADSPPPSGIHPWAWSLVAREAIIAPSNSRSKSKTPTPDDARRLGDAAQQLDEPIIYNDGSMASPLDFAVRTAFNQFPYQTFVMNDIARVRAMLDRDFPADRFTHLSKDFLTGVLGAPVDVFIDSAPFYSAATLKNAGQFIPSWFDQDNFAEVRKRIDVKQLHDLLNTSWSGPFNALRREAQSTATDSLHAIYDWNPLRARPFVRMSNGDYLAPQASWAAQRVSTTSVYYLGMEALTTDSERKEWGGDLGLAQEDYLLDQFKQLEPRAEVHSEIKFKMSGSEAKTVDVILVTPELVLLVESKSLRVRQDSITNSIAYIDRLRRDLDHAFEKQIARTAAMIRDRHDAVKHIPNDRPIIALVATPEPLYFANRQSYRSQLKDPTVPTAVANLTQIERLIAIVLRDTDSGIFIDATTPDAEGNIDVGVALQKAAGNKRPETRSSRRRGPLVDGAFDWRAYRGLRVRYRASRAAPVWRRSALTDYRAAPAR